LQLMLSITTFRSLGSAQLWPGSFGPVGKPLGGVTTTFSSFNGHAILGDWGFVLFQSSFFGSRTPGSLNSY
jgi:hypothetical protein